MIIYLYVKTHNKTGLKYLGQTSATDPHRYPGSGVYWKLHLEKHGYDYTTEILKECQSKEELKELGTYYSNLWNIVESDEWANLKIEQGDGGRQSDEVRKRIGEAGKGRTPWNKGKQIWSEEDRKRISERNKSRPPQSAETIAIRTAKNTGKTRTEETRKKLSAAHSGKTLTLEHKKKLKESRREGIADGRIVPWNKGIKTNVSSSSAKFWRIENIKTGEILDIVSLKKWCESTDISYQCLHRNSKLGKPYKGYVAVPR
jgi:hypothetical protein